MERTSTISLTRDQWGIGHVEGESALDAFWAQGWVGAADRMWQMEWDRRRALGRWAEVVGPAGLAEDIFFRRLNLADTAQRHWQQLQPETQAMTAAYASGVNAWLTANARSLPAEFDAHPEPPEPWEPWHSLALYKVRHLFMGSFARKLWRATLLKAAGPALTLALAPDPLDESPVVPDPPLAGHDAKTVIDLLTAASEWLDPFSKDQVSVEETEGIDSAGFDNAEFDGASNSWAVHGDHTASGSPLLAGDPHRGIEFPNAYHQFHMRCDRFDAVGLGFPGVPGFAHFGHNQSVAWCITHGMADDTDLFVEPGPLPITRTETIEVAGVGPHKVECANTARGPVVLGDPATGPSLALAWTGTHGCDTTFDCLWPMLESSSADAFVDAVKPWVIPVNNVLTADKAGTISFHMRGRVLKRPEVSRWAPVPGDKRFDWDQIPEVEFDDLYAWRNPDRGFLVTANNPQGNGPFISLDFANSSRHDRLIEIMTAALETSDEDSGEGKGLGVNDMARWHLDDLSLLAPKILATVIGTAEPQTELGRLALDALHNWDHRMSAASPGAAVYGVMRRHWTLVVGTAAGLDGFGTSPFGPNWPNAALSSRMLYDAASRLLSSGRWNALPGISTTRSLAQTLGTVLDDTGSELAGRFSDDPATWDWPTIHEMVSPHPLVAALGADAGLDHLTPPINPLPGDGETIRAGTVYPANGDRATLASVARYVFDVGNWDNSGWVVPHGVSAVAGSGHRFDQRQAWLDGDLIPMAYSAKAIAEVAVSTERIR